jgi:hypothetical protein
MTNEPATGNVKQSPSIAAPPVASQEESVARKSKAAAEKAASNADQFNSDTLSAPALFNRANANYSRKNFALAADDFQYLASDSSSAFYDDAKWLLANCYIRIRQNAKATKLLKEIANSASAHKTQARDLLLEQQ